MNQETIWIIIASSLGGVVLCCGVVLCFFGRQVRNLRKDVAAAKEAQPEAPKPKPLPPLDGPGGRVDLEAPPDDWPTPIDGPPDQGPLGGQGRVVMMHPLRVKVVRAEGTLDKPVYCVCQIRGKDQTRSTTRVSGDLFFDHEASLVDYCHGDALQFLLYEQDWGTPDALLGEASLPSEQFIDRVPYETLLPLTQVRPAKPAAGGTWACPRCSFENPDRNANCSACGADRPSSAGAASPVGQASVRVMVTTEIWDPKTTPFFTARWTALDASGRNPMLGEFAMRNDWDGEVGFRFRTKAPVVVSALGRQACMGGIRDNAMVTLWSDETQSELASVAIGPNIALEGGFAFVPFNQPILLEEGKDFRITQTCFPGMADLWFDGNVNPGSLFRWSASKYLEYIGSVYQGGHSFPVNMDKERSETRRASMLNLKLLGEDPPAEAERFRLAGIPVPSPAPVPTGAPPPVQGPPDAAGDSMQIRLICMSPAPKDI